MYGNYKQSTSWVSLDEYQITAAQYYKQQMEAKCILAMVSAATQLYNCLVLPSQRIHLVTSLGSMEEKFMRNNKIIKPHGYKGIISTNLKRLNEYYNQTHLRDPTIPARNIREFLIKMWWMGYQQLPQYINHPYQSTKYLNWQYLRNNLKHLSHSIDTITAIKLDNEQYNPPSIPRLLSDDES